MNRNLASTLVIFLAFILIAPSVFLVAPQRAHALFGLGDITFDPTSWIQNSITAVATPISAAADVAMQINNYVLQPLAYALSGKLMKDITASTIKFTNGLSNGTGRAQFVTDYQTSMQMVGDAQALSFFAQFMQNSTSPFASSVTNALRDNYLRNTSRAGFFSSNRNTLSRSSPNVNRFLAGDWSQGGAGAWFALTTQEQNNPYLLYQNSLFQLGSSVNNASAARTNELAWGQGFMSWCGGSDPNAYVSAPASDNAGNADYPCTMGADCQSGVCMSGNVEIGKSCTNNNECSKGLTCSANSNKACSNTGSGKCTNKYTSKVASSGDPCTNADGTAGTIRTPGSVIGASLNKALGLSSDKLAQMGQMGKEINGILKDVSTVANVANFAQFVLGGGASANSGGILGSGKPSSSNSTSRLAAFGSSDYLGVTQSDVIQNNMPEDPKKLVTDMSKRIIEYKLAWDKIEGVVKTASSNIIDLESYCADQQQIALKKNATDNSSRIFLTNFINDSTEWKDASRDIFKNDISPILVQVVNASSTIKAATAMVNKVNEELTSTTMSISAYTNDIQTLNTMSPTYEDVINAQRDARPFSAAAATLQGVTVVSGTTLLDRLNLIITNTASIKSGDFIDNSNNRDNIRNHSIKFPCNYEASVKAYAAAITKT